LLSTSVQPWPQSICPLRQAHEPAWQVWPSTVHAWPQVPQLLESFVTSVQAAPHGVPPAGQPSEASSPSLASSPWPVPPLHFPAWHVVPDAHA
jgi:hypothetical protein